MNLFKKKQPEVPAGSQPDKSSPKKGGSMNIEVKDLKTILPKLKGLVGKEAKHAAFIAILLVAGVYLYVVWSIGHLATAEPSEEAQTKAQSSSAVPKIDPKAIQQIQKLEASNAQVHSLFNQARNNPFQE